MAVAGIPGVNDGAHVSVLRNYLIEAAVVILRGFHGSGEIIVALLRLVATVSEDGNHDLYVFGIADGNRRCGAVPEEVQIYVMTEGYPRVLADPEVHRMTR